MNANDYLDEVTARADAATDGPWETTQAADEESTTWIEHESGDVLNHDERGDGHMRENFSWMKRADAEFIAAARSDVPRMAAALHTILDLHCENEHGECDECGVRYDYPCPTVRVITEKLGVDA